MAHKLLLADDSVTIQRVIELTFADEDVQVVAVGDGQQAIDRLPSERPDIVLADIGMPERDGYEVASFIRNHSEFSHIPVLLLTGAFEPIDEGRAREVGCDGVLVKPFEPQMVISRVKELLSGKRPPKPAPEAPAQASAESMQAAPASPERAGQEDGSGGGATGSIEDYFDRLDAAFGSADAPATQPAGGLPPVSPTDKTQPIPIPPRSLGDELANWDPDLSGTPSSAGDTVLSLDDLKDEPAQAPSSSADASMPGQAPQTFSFAAATPVAPPAPPPASEPPRPIGFAAAGPVAPPETPSTLTPPPAAPSQRNEPSASAPAPASASMQAPTLAQAFAALLSAEQGQVSPISAPQQVGEDIVDQVTRRVIEKLGDRTVRDIVLEVAERLVREEIERIKNQAR